MSTFLSWAEEQRRRQQPRVRRSTKVFLALVALSVAGLLLTGCALNRAPHVIETMTLHRPDGSIESVSTTDIDGGGQKVMIGGKLAEGVANLHYEAGQNENGDDFLIATGASATGLETESVSDTITSIMGAIQALTAISSPTGGVGPKSTPTGVEIVEPGAAQEQVRLMEQLRDWIAANSRQMDGVNEAFVGLGERLGAIEAELRERN